MENTSHTSRILDTGSISPTSTLLSGGLDLSAILPIAVLDAHMKDEEAQGLRETLRKYDAPLTTDLSRARLFIGKVGTKRRAEFELRARKFVVEDAGQAPIPDTAAYAPRKRRKTSQGPNNGAPPEPQESAIEQDVAVDSETEDEARGEQEQVLQPTTLLKFEANAQLYPLLESNCNADIIWVVRLDWLYACVTAGEVVPVGEHLVYKGKVKERPKSVHTTSVRNTIPKKATPSSQALLATRPQSGDILDRSKTDSVSSTARKASHRPPQFGNHASRRFEGKSFVSSGNRNTPALVQHTAHLLQLTTSEYNGTDSDFPEPPKWVKDHIKYACQRFTPANGPNEDFLEQLKKIRTARTLIDDQIGVRAYSTIIASIAAYPYKLSHPRELAQLPGCDEKTVNLFVEWKNTGRLQAVEDYENDEAMKVLRAFYDIWGVGAKTARHFYYNNHWTELDDIIEFGWSELDRVQQIGLKYYDEFLVPIPRPEVEDIASIVRSHATRLRDDRITVTIVGGYRRGKAASGDVDMIVSHPDLNATAHLVREIVESLETAEFITHTLTMSLTNTNRGQNPLPFRSVRGKGAGYDTLDKALVVWQDPTWPTRDADIAANPAAKNPNIHRRVDIIIAPWRTVGCAVMGWSGGTTFQRDLRRYAKAVKGWKFDSSGVRSRADGSVVFLEGEEGIQGTPEEAEKRVFEGLGLEYVPPEYRVTY